MPLPVTLFSFFRSGARWLLPVLLFLGASLRSRAQTNEGVVPDATELSVLRELYTTTGGPKWTKQTNWLQGTTLADAATWAGVTVTNGDVTGLRLDYNNLVGVPPVSLSQLTQLQTLNLYYNQLSGSLPAAWSQLTQLQDLELSYNQFTGSLPDTWSQLIQLQDLELDENQLSGPLPPTWGQLTQLQTLYLGGNYLTGSLPDSWGQLPQLQELNMSYNRLSGSLPAAWSQLLKLRVLVLYHNQFTGSLPTTWGQLPQLQILYLYDNQLSGTLPASWSQLPQLVWLFLQRNQLSGTLPASWSQLPQLMWLYLQDNQLSGSLPATWSQLFKLQTLYLGGNQLSGSLPATWSQLTQLQDLDLSDNQLSGSLPATWSQFPQLQGLYLYNNQLSGSVPAALAKLPTLTTLWLQQNAFTALPAYQAGSAVNNFNVASNYLKFANLESYYAGGTPQLATFSYVPQRTPDGADQVSYVRGADLKLSRPADGAHTLYQWEQQVGATWVPIAGATAPTLTIARATEAQRGLYRLRETNTWVPNLTIYQRSLNATMQIPVPDNPSDDLDRNWTLERTYDGNGQVVAESKQFTDGLGRATQAQARNAAIQQVFASQTVYNTGGQPVLQTLAAPTNNQSFAYKADFVTAAGQPYGPTNFEGTKANLPDAVDATGLGTLGYYFSKNNATEPLTPLTSYPYSLVEPYAGPLGGTRRAAGPGDALRMGQGREAKGREFLVRREFDAYLQLRPQFVPAGPLTTLEYQATKTVSVDADGRETIVVQDKEGQALLSCRSGAQYPALPVAGYLSAVAAPAVDPAAPNYVDLHIPAAGSQVVTFTSAPGSVVGSVRLVNLLSDASYDYPVTTASAVTPAAGAYAYAATSTATTVTLPPGFYRVVSLAGTQRAAYEVHYGNFSYTYYDEAGRAVATVAPKGLEGTPAATTPLTYVTRNTYDTSGRLLATESTDEGRSEYVYAQDGRIRFSQSALQRPAKRFSYSNYDAVGRVVESGEYTPGTVVFENHLTPTPSAASVLQPAVLEDRTRTGGLSTANCAQRNQVWYDLPWDGTPGSLGTDAPLNGRQQQFVVGAVAKTQNENVTTWYSYDELGRVTWVVQNLVGVGVKTLDYQYDFSGNVLQVVYQKGQADAFTHYYGYDVAQRLTKVYTSPDGVALTLQAEYTYYLHGPLKRVQVAGNLQGVDYVYTLQGALKSINHTTSALEPGQDAPATNGVYKDLFAFTLEYFSGDYRSKAIDVPAPPVPGTPAADRFDGTIRSASWRTAASADIQRMAYTYDEQSQLQNSTYSNWQLLNKAYQLNAASTSRFQEGGLKYDANGNLLALQRTGATGAVTDNFSYVYKANTNQLAAVHTGSASGATVLDYDYDELGQMTRQGDEQGQRYFSYDVTGKTTGVYLDAAHQQPVVDYAYDDRGFRVRQRVYPPGGAAAHVTTYVRDVAGNLLALYEQATPTSPAVRSEVPLYGSGRLGTLTHLASGVDDYRYELTDHLGNARVVFHRPTTAVQVETMELSGVSPQAAFLNDDLYRVPLSGAPSGVYVARLTDTQPAGQELKRVLSVTKGDTITFSALALWQQPAAVTSSATPYVLAGALATGADGSSQRGAEGQPSAPTTGPRTWLSRLAVGLGFTLGTHEAKPQLGATSLTGWIKYRVLDAQGNEVTTGRANVLGTGQWESLQTGVRVAQNGTIEVMVGTTGSGPAVYFDNLRVEQTSGLIVQEQHQYAFGAPLPGLSYTVGNRRYRYGYQGQYAEHDSLTGFESFELRLYNSRIGRWMSYDSYGQFDSPYVGMGNNPVSGIDPDGGFCETCPAAFNVALTTVAVTAPKATGAFARMGLGAVSTALRAADAYGRYGVGVWKGIGSGLYDTGSWAAGLLPGTDRHSWRETGQGLSALATLGNPYSVDGMIMRAQLAGSTADYVKNVPNMLAEEIGYDVGYAGEKVAEAVVLERGAGVLTNFKNGLYAESIFTSKHAGITSKLFGNSEAGASGLLNKTGSRFKMGWSGGPGGRRIRIGIGKNPTSPNQALYHLDIRGTIVPNDIGNYKLYLLKMGR